MDRIDGSLDYAAVVEGDAPWTGQLMAIGVRPGPKKEVKRYFNDLCLL